MSENHKYQTRTKNTGARAPLLQFWYSGWTLNFWELQIQRVAK